MKHVLFLATLLLLPLAAFGQQRAVETARQHLDANREVMKVTEADLADIVVTDAYTDKHSGVTHVYFRQRYQGIEVHGANVGVHVTPGGKVLHWNGDFIGGLADRVNATAPALAAVVAVEAAARDLGLAARAPFEVVGAAKGGPAQEMTLSDGGIAVQDIPARLVYQPMPDGTLRLAWNLQIYQKDQQHYWNLRVDAVTGRVLDRDDWVVHDTWSKPEAVKTEAFSLAERTAPLAGPRVRPVESSGFAGSLVPQYRVYGIPNESPRHAGTDQNAARFDDTLRDLLADPSNPTASPFGWHSDGTNSYTITRGNNVWAYEDTQNSGVPPTGTEPVVAGISAQGGPALNFDFDLDLTQEPTVEDPAGTGLLPQNVSSVITNLFYMNNIMHDVFYQYGFDEASGNMQENNFGNGGLGGDAVRAEAQDGSGANNANMATPADGGNPRMQMFLWPQVGEPTIDGDLDNGVIAHEYGHSISIRMTGGPSTNCLGGDEQAGEGWSDYFGLMLTMQDPGTGVGPGPRDRGIGTYVFNEPPDGDGIRPTRYSPNMAINPTTYGDIGGLAAPHGVGYAFATILWDMTWNLIDAKGFNPDVYVPGTDPSAGGNNIALQLVIDGIKLQPCSPTFVQSRDAILAADRLLFPENDPGTPQESLHEDLIWESFARRGVGFSADAGTNAQGDEVEAFDLPRDTREVLTFEKSAPAFVAAGSPLTYTLTADNTAGPQSGVTITDAVPSGSSFIPGSATCDNSATGSESVGTVTFGPFSMADGEIVTCTFDVLVDAAPFTTALFEDGIESGTGNWTTTSLQGNAGDEWQVVQDDPHTGANAWFVRDPANFSEQFLTLDVDVPLAGNAHLSFWHNYQTEANFDAGVAEFSTDGGLTWQDLEPYFVQEGYNSDIPLLEPGFPTVPSTSPLRGRNVFGGSSGGYVQTFADLSSFAGQSMRVRFYFAADVLVSAVGWWVDDVAFLDLVHLTNEACIDTNEVAAQCSDLGAIGTIVLESNVLTVDAKVLLEGAHDGGSGMTADLNAGGDLPTTQPYDGAAYAGTPLAYGGSERVPVGFFDDNPDVVDWVLLDLRTGPNAADRVARRAALLKTDGSIVDVDGTSAVSFPSVSAGDFYVVVRHRNHLPAMSDGFVQVAGNALAIDFTDGQAAGFQPMKEVAPGTFALYSGDADADGQVQNDDKNVQWRNQVGQSGYRAADFNLNGQVQNDDKNLFWRPNSGRGTLIDQ